MNSLNDMMSQFGFVPNKSQHNAIHHINGPLFLTAGPGSGKTRVLLWRTVNLIVFHNIDPKNIFLSTFTEKSAFQLKEGLRSLLGYARNLYNKPFDISEMYIGTLHSLCQKILTGRRFKDYTAPKITYKIMDEIEQFFYLSNTNNLLEIFKYGGFNIENEEEILNNYEIINEYINGKKSKSKYFSVKELNRFFNRMSEENIDPDTIKKENINEIFVKLLLCYKKYENKILTDKKIKKVDFSLLQQNAFSLIQECKNKDSFFEYVIVDEYQDTNYIQEKIYFELYKYHKNICVVGDDDQALYRFRGASVENFVEFENRCINYLNISPKLIPLNINYRSRKQIVDFYKKFIESIDWKKENSLDEYRISNKNIVSASIDEKTAVIVTEKEDLETVCAKIAKLVKKLILEKKVIDPNQIAFLYPSLQSAGQPNLSVMKMMAALNEQDLKVFAPRATSILQSNEALKLFGIFILIFGRPDNGTFNGREWKQYQDWLEACESEAIQIINSDKDLKYWIEKRKEEVNRVANDSKVLFKLFETNNFDLNSPFEIRMKSLIINEENLSEQAKKLVLKKDLDNYIKLKQKEGNPILINYLINRISSLDWNLLDLFYRVSTFTFFKNMFDSAETGKDDKSITFLSVFSQYLSGYSEQNGTVITGKNLYSKKFQQVFFNSYLYTHFRHGEGEYEDKENPFPKGYIPFLTIHQSKGLEFPVVILGSLGKKNRGVDELEKMTRELHNRIGEPLEKIFTFDAMRVFYVALSRAENLLILSHSKGSTVFEPFKEILANSDLKKLDNLNLDDIPEEKKPAPDFPKTYSFTSDFLIYDKCPRNYMVFQKYGFVPSRSQTMLFGSVVHKTIEDLHLKLIAEKNKLRK